MEPFLKTAIRAAKKAGDVIMPIYAREFSIEEKEDKSPVTEADIAADKVLHEVLKETKIAIRSEETEDDLSILENEYLWVVDPIDGTKDFIQKNGEFCVMIGLLRNKQPILGVIYGPALGYLYYAEKNKGAFVSLGDGTVHELSIGNQESLAEASLVVSRNHFGDIFTPYLEKTGITNMKHFGSNGLKLCKVAEGSFDMMFNPTPYLSEWDSAAAQIIIEEAGGIMSGVNGKPLNYAKENSKNPYGVLAANKQLVTQFLEKTHE
ncbi:3'(2'),5'-bisphosphate nucleotidase CysQ [Candidatus Dojkabacteria bacterium]|uniref:3'(2'),5'-bisphosphate nucleotidase CysQ n=1 Tax=Candidatus Dojkabacteria bacterium TaxID=2099670 RepID=A0A955RKQ7_9BACT|nr:3'(2'),5'-bisphosphate nucleotidase CysQ [Candidatus Dojkabacteria bacterium]